MDGLVVQSEAATFKALFDNFTVKNFMATDAEPLVDGFRGEVLDGFSEFRPVTTVDCHNGQDPNELSVVAEVIPVDRADHVDPAPGDEMFEEEVWGSVGGLNVPADIEIPELVVPPVSIELVAVHHVISINPIWLQSSFCPAIESLRRD